MPDPLNAQAWNRYSYVGNDPLAFTDPSGYSWLSSFFHSVGTFVRSVLANPIVRAVAQIAVTAILSVTGVGMVVAAAAGAAIVNGLSGGNLGTMLRSAAIAGATAFAFNFVGGTTQAIASTNGTDAAYAFNVAGHAGVGCLTSVASGGSCQSGALAGGVSAAASPLITNVSGGGDFISGVAVRGIVGGLASIAGGGKFENGAVTAAFGYLFNERLHINQLDVGRDAHEALQGFVEEVPGMFVESSSDKMGTTFWGRVDIGNSVSKELWEIKPNNAIGIFAGRVEAEFYSLGTIYSPGGLPGFLPSVPLQGKYGSYTYAYADWGVIVYDKKLSPEYTYSTVPQRSPVPFGLPAAGTILRFLPVIP